MTTAKKSYRVFLVDDHALFLSGLRGLLARYPDIEIVGEAANGEEFLRLLPDCACDVVLMDIDMPGMNGVQATEEALRTDPPLNIVTLSMHGEESFYFRMVEAGAKGFLLKNSDIKEVVDAIRTVAGGGTYFSQELLFSLVGSLKSTRREEEGGNLSEREKEILLLVCKGLSNQEIGDTLFISKRTVDKHRANILEKTGCRNTANLVVYAIKNSLAEI